MANRSTYEIRIQGHLDLDWSDWFENLHISHEADGNTTLSGRIVDQAALYGLMTKLRDLGLILISVKREQVDEN
jgi:hypothetical protein